MLEQVDQAAGVIDVVRGGRAEPGDDIYVEGPGVGNDRRAPVAALLDLHGHAVVGHEARRHRRGDLRRPVVTDVQADVVPVGREPGLALQVRQHDEEVGAVVGPGIRLAAGVNGLVGERVVVRHVVVGVRDGVVGLHRWSLALVDWVLLLAP